MGLFFFRGRYTSTNPGLVNKREHCIAMRRLLSVCVFYHSFSTTLFLPLVSEPVGTSAGEPRPVPNSPRPVPDRSPTGPRAVPDRSLTGPWALGQGDASVSIVMLLSTQSPTMSLKRFVPLFHFFLVEFM